MQIDRDLILSAFHGDANLILKIKEIGNAVGVEAEDRATLRRLVHVLVDEGDLLQHAGRRYSLPADGSLVEGRVQLNRKGFGFLVPVDDTQHDAFLSPDQVVGILDGDIVLCRIRPTPKGPEGKIVKVVSRARSTVTGTLRRRRNAAFVESDALSSSILLTDDAGPDSTLPPDGSVVEVLVEQFPTHVTSAVGRIVRVIGNEGDIAVEIERIVVDAGVTRAFSPEALSAADNLGHEPTDDDIRGREDFRVIPLVTIDGETAKDFDDAVFAERVGRDIRVVVAIADVSHYVKDGSALDEDARGRGTSIYYPGRVIPMLPFSISDNLCSLVPYKNRLCMVADLRINDEGKIVDSRFAEGVMKSAARLTYTEVQQFFDDDTDVVARLDAPVKASLNVLRDAAARLRKMRSTRGAMDFELTERVIEVDKTGEPTSIHPLQRNSAHKMIEDLMIAANEAVAEHFNSKDWPCIYRVHEPPDPEKLENFLTLARALVVDAGVPTRDASSKPGMLSTLLRSLREHRMKSALDYLLLRAMKQAVYAADNLGHFGLGSDAYLHFTSPIRRYPDLVVHRLMRARLRKDATKARAKRSPNDDALFETLEEIASRTSELERRATDIERKVDALYGAWLMKDRVGESFEGVASGCAEFGVFVRLDTPDVEGMIPTRTMTSEMLNYDELRMRLRSPRSGFEIGLGDRIAVTCVRVDLARRQTEFALERVTNQHGVDVDITPRGAAKVHGTDDGGPRGTDGDPTPPGFRARRDAFLRERNRGGDGPPPRRGQRDDGPPGRASRGGSDGGRDRKGRDDGPRERRRGDPPKGLTDTGYAPRKPSTTEPRPSSTKRPSGRKPASGSSSGGRPSSGKAGGGKSADRGGDRPDGGPRGKSGESGGGKKSPKRKPPRR